MPRSGAITARLPRSSRVPRPASHPSTRDRLYGSRWSNPFVTSTNRAVSRTERETHPSTAVREPTIISGLFGIRPYVHFSPNKPVNPAGMRSDPPPSPPVPTVASPPETAAAPPPGRPAGVGAGAHGLRVTPLRFVRVRFTPPNSLDVVRPTSTAPASRKRCTSSESWVATWSFSGTLACVYGQPATESSSLTPTGTPPNDVLTSARVAASRAASTSRCENALSSEASIATSVASSSSAGVRSPDRNASTSEHASPSHGVSVMRRMLRAPCRGDFYRRRQRRDQTEGVLEYGFRIFGGGGGGGGGRPSRLGPRGLGGGGGGWSFRLSRAPAAPSTPSSRVCR